VLVDLLVIPFTERRKKAKEFDKTFGSPGVVLDLTSVP